MHSELRGSSSIVRESKQRNMTRTPTYAKLKKHNNKLSESWLEKTSVQEDAKKVHEQSRQHKRHSALRHWTKEADAASTTTRDAINTNVLQEPYVEHQAEERSYGFRSNLNANDNNDSHSHQQQPGAHQPAEQMVPTATTPWTSRTASVQGEHYNHECHASRTIKKDAGLDSRCGPRYCQSRHLCRYQEIRGNQLRRQ